MLKRSPYSQLELVLDFLDAIITLVGNLRSNHVSIGNLCELFFDMRIL